MIALELDVVAIPGQVTGGGIAKPPRPGASFAVPAGFVSAGATYASTYTVLRFAARRPLRVSSMTLGPSHLGTGGFTILVQSPRPR